MTADPNGISRRAFVAGVGLGPALAMQCDRVAAQDPPQSDKDQTTEYSELKTEFEEYGFVVLPKVIPTDTAERAEHRIRQIMNRQRDADKVDQHLPGFFNHIDADDDSLFLPLVTQPICLRLARDFLGPDFQMTEIGCRWRKPGAPEGPVHVGSPLPAMARAGLPVPNTTFVIAFSWILHDITKEMGTSFNLPFSHHAQRSPRETAHYKYLVPVEAPAGSLLIYHGAIWHNFGANTTRDKSRVGLMGGYFSRWLDPVAVGWQPMKRKVFRRMPEQIQRMNQRVTED